MSELKTLLQLAGADLEPAKLNSACLVLIDMQNEYLEGPIAVVDADAAIAHAKSLLENAREAGSPVIHVALYVVWIGISVLMSAILAGVLF